jgi:hypothetical protein
LLLCIFFNAIFAGLIFLMADKILEGLNQWVTPFIQSGVPNLPDDMRSALNEFGNSLAQLRVYLLPALAALSAAVTLLLWFFLFLLGARQIRKAGERVPVYWPQPQKPSSDAAAQS